MSNQFKDGEKLFSLQIIAQDKNDILYSINMDYTLSNWLCLEFFKEFIGKRWNGMCDCWIKYLYLYIKQLFVWGGIQVCFKLAWALWNFVDWGFNGLA